MSKRENDSGREEVDPNAQWIVDEIAAIQAEDAATARAEREEQAERSQRDAAEPTAAASPSGFLDLADALDEVRRTSPMPPAARRARPRRWG
ncbi:hypothetical protein ACWDTI_25370 [Gordonia sp. NPDC003424]